MVSNYFFGTPALAQQQIQQLQQQLQQQFPQQQQQQPQQPAASPYQMMGYPYYPNYQYYYYYPQQQPQQPMARNSHGLYRPYPTGNNDNQLGVSGYAAVNENSPPSYSADSYEAFTGKQKFNGH